MQTSTVIWSFTVAGLMTGGIFPRADCAALAQQIRLLDCITSCYMFAKPTDGCPLLPDGGATFFAHPAHCEGVDGHISVSCVKSLND